MKKDLSPLTVGIAIGVVAIIAVLIIVFGVFKPQIGAGPEIKPRPFSPAGYAGAPANVGQQNQAQQPQQQQQQPQPPGQSTASPYYRPPGGPVGAPAQPPTGTNSATGN